MGHKIQEMRARTNLAGMLMNSGNNTAGILEAETALKFFEKTESDYWIALNANNIADAYLEDERLDEAEYYARKVIELEEPSWYGYGIFTFGDIQRRKNDFSSAIETLKMSLTQANRTEDRYLKAYCYQALGEAQIGLGNNEKAKEILIEAKKLFEEMDIPSELEKTHSLINSIN